MLKSELKFFQRLKVLNEKYIINEADEKDESEKNSDESSPFPTEPEESQDSEGQDPTVTPEDDIPNNEQGSYMSDTKLSMLASLLAKAATSAPIQIPSELMPVTVTNANQVIQYVENQLKLDDPQKKIEKGLSNIS